MLGFILGPQFCPLINMSILLSTVPSWHEALYKIWVVSEVLQLCSLFEDDFEFSGSFEFHMNSGTSVLIFMKKTVQISKSIVLKLHLSWGRFLFEQINSAALLRLYLIHFALTNCIKQYFVVFRIQT